MQTLLASVAHFLRYCLREFGFKLSVIAAPVCEQLRSGTVFRSRLLLAFISLKRYVFQGSMRVPAAGAHLEFILPKIVLSLGCGAHVFF